MVDFGQLHVFRRTNSEHIQGPLQLRQNEASEPQQDIALLAILFGQHRMLVIEIVKRLRQLERILGDMRRLAGVHRARDGGIRLGSDQQKLPEIFGR